MARKCTVCEHPKRKAIEEAIVALESNRRIASQHGLSEIAVRRHKSDHLAQAMAATSKPVAACKVPIPSRILTQPSQPSQPDHSAEVTEIAHADRLVDQVVNLQRRAEGLLVQVEHGAPNEMGDTVVDFKAATGLIREMRSCIELNAKLLGELQTNQAAQVYANPFWIRMRDAIAKELEDDPETLMKFAAAVRRVAGQKQRLI